MDIVYSFLLTCLFKTECPNKGMMKAPHVLVFTCLINLISIKQHVFGKYNKQTL